MAESKRSDVPQPGDKNSSNDEDTPAAPDNPGLVDSNMMLGEFRLLRKLGMGGMAEVFLAEQTTLRRQVAVKVLRSEYVKVDAYVKRFRHEAAAAGSLNHPNIVQVYMVGEQDGINYIAQEYVQGRTLKEYLKRKGPMEIKLALHILRQVASALQVASENGIVHRDIKPENILLTNKGEAKVADFGLAQLTLQGERVSLTQSGITMGTPLYMSPEQVNGQPLDSRSDIYSFGIMAWHMFAGRPPFMGESAMAVAIKHLNEKPPLLTDFREDLPASIRDFIKRLIQKKKEDRPADLNAVLSEIKLIIRQISGKDDVTVPINSSQSQRMMLFDRPFRSQIGWLIGACLLIMSITGGIGWCMRTPDLKAVQSTGALTVRQMPNADAQLYWAATNPQDEAAWIAVKTYNGATDEMKARAQTALGLIYLKSNRRPLAETTFNDLVTEPKFKANGFAGLALLSSLKGENDQAKKQIAQVDTIDATLFPEIDAPYKELRQKLVPTN